MYPNSIPDVERSGPGSLGHTVRGCFRRGVRNGKPCKLGAPRAGIPFCNVGSGPEPGLLSWYRCSLKRSKSRVEVSDDESEARRISCGGTGARRWAGSRRGYARTRGSKSGRESIESFVVVFLAFLLWSLEAEGFVVPTGSMAPTLMGRHKEIVCPQCGYRYTVNADREVETSGAALGAGQRIAVGTCENCRYECQVGDAPSFSGDRIYVMKDGLSLPFFAGAGNVKLNRWDVAVFKLPEEPEVRYIKRLVGMPNEVVRIEGGDLWSRPLSQEGDFQRLRRPLDHQQAMQSMVYDDAHRPAALRDDPRWQRFAPARTGDWTEPTPGEFVPADGRRSGSSSATSISFRPRNIGGPSAKAPPAWPASSHADYRFLLVQHRSIGG